MGGHSTEESLARPERGAMRASQSGKWERLNCGVGLEGGEAEGGVRMQPRERAGVDGVTAWPTPNFKRATGAERGEAVAMCGRVIPGKDLRVQGEKVRGAGAAGGRTPGVERLQFGRQAGGDEASARAAQRLVEILRG